MTPAQYIRTKLTLFTLRLYEFMTARYSSAYIARLGLTLLNIWQAYVLINRNYWIPNLIDSGNESVIIAFTVYSIFLAILSVYGMFTPYLETAMAVLILNFIQYFYITIASLWFIDPPRASAGLTGFIALVAASSFWRVMLLWIRRRQRPDEKIDQWTTKS